MQKYKSKFNKSKLEVDEYIKNFPDDPLDINFVG